MADNRIVEYSGQYIRNATGGTAGGAKLYVYDAGTTDLASIYTNTALTVASANPVIAGSDGLMPFAYRGIASYKVVLKTSADVTLDTEDNLPGALDSVPQILRAAEVRIDRPLCLGKWLAWLPDVEIGDTMSTGPGARR